jgi:hypothetical protein
MQNIDYMKLILLKRRSSQNLTCFNFVSNCITLTPKGLNKTAVETGNLCQVKDIKQAITR